MTNDTWTPRTGTSGAPIDVERKDRYRQPSLLLTALSAVIVLDQVTKWWGWRHVSLAIVNPGGDFLVGRTISGWYAGQVSGALLDLVSFGALSTAVSVLVRRRRPVLVTVSGAVMIGGWSSNLLDRLGLHYWTAPGSARGAVDFLPFVHHMTNVADFAIGGATLVFVLAVGCVGRRSAYRSAAVRAVLRPRNHRPRRRRVILAFAGALCLITAVVAGAVNNTGVTTTPLSLTSSSRASEACRPTGRRSPRSRRPRR